MDNKRTTDIVELKRMLDEQTKRYYKSQEQQELKQETVVSITTSDNPHLIVFQHEIILMNREQFVKEARAVGVHILISDYTEADYDKAQTRFAYYDIKRRDQIFEWLSHFYGEDILKVDRKRITSSEAKPWKRKL